MARTKTSRADRYLISIGGRYHYRRAVPVDLSHLDSRAPRIQKALKTGDIEIARRRRDDFESRDDAIWAALRSGGAEEIRKAFGLSPRSGLPDDINELRKAVKAARFISAAPAGEHSTRTAGDILSADQLLDLGLRRGDQIPVTGTAVSNEQRAKMIGVILGDEGDSGASGKKLSEALEIYIDVIAAPILSRKSKEQRREWIACKRRAIATLIEVVGDIEIGRLTRKDTLALYFHLRGRVMDPSRKFGFDAAKRQLGDARSIIDDYVVDQGLDMASPFDGLPKLKRMGKLHDEGRETIPVEMVEAILKNKRLLGMGRERRLALLVIAMTGARPSEVINLQRSQICIDAPIPYISIRAEGREVKTQQSIRKLPLVGLALEVMRRCPDGFPSLLGRGNSFSAAANKFLKEHDLLTGGRTVYSLRHGAEDRLKDGGIPDDIRRRVLGHAENREQYGRSFNLQSLLTAMEALDLEYDPAILG